MRSRAQIAKILSDTLTNKNWSKLRNGTIGKELIAIGTEIVYGYELYAHKNPGSGAITPQSLNDYKQAVSSYLSSHGWNVTTDTSKELILWAAEVCLQSALVLRKNYDDLTYSTASYPALIGMAYLAEIPVSDFKPATITVTLPVGNKVYKPYEIAIHCGAAGFYNIKTYRSGEQATLYQGIPYCYINGTEDVSSYPSCLQFESTIKNVNGKRYVALTDSTYPESVEGYSLTGVPAIHKSTIMDGTQVVLLDDNFVSNEEDWCIRFLSLSNVEFDISSVTLPDDFTLLAYSVASVGDVDYARSYFARSLFVEEQVTITTDVLKSIICGFPNVLDCYIYLSSTHYSIYIKPVEGAKSVIFDELEDFLNDNDSTHTYTTYCGYPRKFSILIKKKTLSKFTDALEARIENYLNQRYGYGELMYDSSVLASDIKTALMLAFGLESGDLDVTIRITETVNAGKIEFNNGAGAEVNITENSIQLYNPDFVGWDNSSSSKIQFVTSPSSWNHASVGGHACYNIVEGFDKTTPTQKVRVNTYASIIENNSGGVFYLGSGVVAYVDGATVKLYDASHPYFKNPGGISLSGIPSYTITSEAASVIASVQSVPSLQSAVAGIPVYSGTTLTVPRFYAMEILDENRVYIHVFVNGGSSFHKLVFTPTTATGLSLYNNNLYISCDDGSVIIMRAADTITSGYDTQSEDNVVNIPVVDIDGNRIANYALCSWANFKFSVDATQQEGTKGAAKFSMLINPYGVELVYLDPTDYGTDVFAGYNLGDTSRISIADRYTDDVKRMINSRWKMVSAGKVKETSVGLALINQIERFDVPSKNSIHYRPSHSESTSYLVDCIEFGPWILGGRTDSTLGMIQQMMVLPSPYATEENSYFNNSYIYSVDTDLVTVTEHKRAAERTTSAMSVAVDTKAYTVNTDAGTVVYSPSGTTPASISFTGGPYSGATMTIGVDRVSTVPKKKNQYIQLDDKIVIWQ